MTNLKSVVPAGTYLQKLETSTPDLVGFRVELVRQRQFRMEQLRDLADNVSDGPAGAHDEVTAALMAAAEVVLADIDAALHRIDTGSFGFCQLCGNPIALERLEALPMASLCMRCQFAKETNGPRYRS